MAILWLLWQPIVPATLSACGCDAESCESGNYISSTDTVDIQFQVEPCEGADSNTFDTFEVSPEWAEMSGIVCAEGSGFAGGLIANPTYARFFKIVVVVSGYFSGSLTMVVEGGETFTFSSNGTFTVYSTAPPAVAVEINFSSDSFVGCFARDIEVTPIASDYKMVLINSDGIPVFIFDEFDIDGNYITFHNDINLIDVLPNGCYQWGLLDPCENTCNQNFLPGAYLDLGSFSTYWTNITIPNEWEIVLDGQLSIEVATNGGHTVANNELLCNGTYTVTYTITSIDSPNQLRVTAGTTGAIRTAPGTYTDTLTVSSQAPLQNRLLFSATFNDVAGGFIVVENIQFNRLPAQIVADKFSRPYSIGSTNDCLLEMEGCSTGEVFGFNFNNFRPKIRVKGSIEAPKYESDAEIFRYKSGLKEVVYADVIKQKNVAIEAVPEYIHDFLSIWRFLDNSFINGFKVIIADIDYPELNFLNGCSAGVTLPIEQNPQKRRKVKCGPASECVATTNDIGKDFESGNAFLFESGIRFLFNRG